MWYTVEKYAKGGAGMGIYLNPGNEGFRESINSEIYVDKTGMIAYTNRSLNTMQKFICVSRPRRFGKSMALNMLAAYYSRGCDSRELFERYKIAREKSFEEHLNQYNVIALNIQQFLSTVKDAKLVTDYLQNAVTMELRELYGEKAITGATTLAEVLNRIYQETGRKYVFLIDEWDCIFREKQEAAEIQRNYLDFMRNLLKDQPYVALAYMTGILPIKKYGTHSALNMFREFSMTNPFMLEEYVGFTEEEVKNLCEKYQMDFEETKNWYDGYRFLNTPHIYNPKSVVEAMLLRQFWNYWTETETYEALKVYIEMNFDGLREAVTRMLGGGRVRIDTRSFQNDMKTFESKDDVLTLLIHLGYLAYDSEDGEVWIPNKEIRDEFENAVRGSGWKEVMEILNASERLLLDTLSGNEEAVAEALDKTHEEVASVLTYNDENSLSCAISLAYYSARKHYRLIRELPTGRGFADVVFLPKRNSDKPALVVELKYNKAAETAIRQIKEKKYTKALEGYAGKILLVGINYDRETKKHSCVIERWSVEA